jgi:hypothetical protein
MADANKKFYVGNEFRKNKLVEKESPIVAEVHQDGKPIKSYVNIHYPEAFANRVFKNSPLTSRVIFRNTSDGSETTIMNNNG